MVAALSACGGEQEKPQQTPVEQPEFVPMENLPAGTRTVVQVHPAKTEALQAAVMSRFEGGAPMPADLDVGLAATNAALVFPPQPGRLLATAPGRDPLPSLDRTRPIFHALSTDSAIGFLDSIRIGRTPAQTPSLGARLYLPAKDATKLAEEFGTYCSDPRAQSLHGGCTTVAKHAAKQGWVVVELDYGGATPRVRTEGATKFSRDTAAVRAFLTDDSAVSIWFDVDAVSEVGAVMEWHGFLLDSDDSEANRSLEAEKLIEAMAPMLRSDPGARETEDITFSLRVEGERDLALDGVRTLTQRGLARAEAGQKVTPARSFDVKTPIVRGELPWSMSGIRAATEIPEWAEGEAEIGRLGSGWWRRAVAWLEAPFAYYVGLAWGPRPTRAAGWIRVFFGLDGARLRLDAAADKAMPSGVRVDGGLAVVSRGNESRASIANIVETYTRQAAGLVSSTYDFQIQTADDQNDIFALFGKTRATDSTPVTNQVLHADLTRVADLLDSSGNSGILGPQLGVMLRAAGAAELTVDRNGTAEAWRLHIGTDEIAAAEAVPTDAQALLLEPIDPCVIEARRASVKGLREVARGGETTAVDFEALSTKCTTDEGKRLLKSPPAGTP